MPESQLFVELFPIRVENLPSLTAYRMVTADSSVQRLSDRQLGQRVARRLRSTQEGAWLWLGSRIVTDTTPNPVKLAIAIEALRESQPDVFGHLEGLAEDIHWSPTAEVRAEYALKAVLPLIEPEIQTALAATAYGIRNALVEREYRTRAWVVEGSPALSVLVMSRLLYEVPVSRFMMTLEKPADIAGFIAAVKSAPIQGEILKVSGKAGSQRAKLLKAAESDDMRATIAAADDDTPVLRLSINGEESDFVSDALWLVIRSEDIGRFDINRAQAEKALHLTPALRSQMIKVVSDVLKGVGLIQNSYTSGSVPALFSERHTNENVMLGGSRARPYDAERTPFEFEKAGLFKLREDAHGEVRLNVINALGDGDAALFVSDFLEAMRRQMERAFSQKLVIVKERRMRVSTQSNLESGVRALQKEPADCLLIFLPDAAGAETSGFSDEATLSDQYARAQIIGRGQPCLIVTESLMHKPEAMLTVIMGVLARIGHTPFILETPLSFCDRVIGLFLSRQKKKDGDHIHAMARIYRSDGLLMRATLAHERVEPDQPPGDDLFARVLPKALISKKRVVLHHEGRIHRDVMRALGGWEDAADSTFSIVDIIQRGVPRLYAFSPGKITPPAWGTTFRLNDREAFVVTSLGGIDATPQPLHISTEPPLTIDQAVQSVIAFTLFHHGAITRPRLPVTVHHEDLIRMGVERGLLPDALETTLPFWL